jgi:hypothetical protein
MNIEDYMVPCLSKSLFGVECLGCGTQRALVLVLKGEFTAAFYMYPAIYTLLLLFISIGLHFIDKSRNYHTLIRVLAISNASIMIISYIYKQTHL